MQPASVSAEAGFSHPLLCKNHNIYSFLVTILPVFDEHVKIRSPFQNKGYLAFELVAATFETATLSRSGL